MSTKLLSVLSGTLSFAFGLFPQRATGVFPSSANITSGENSCLFSSMQGIPLGPEVPMRLGPYSRVISPDLMRILRRWHINPWVTLNLFSNKTSGTLTPVGLSLFSRSWLSKCTTVCTPPYVINMVIDCRLGEVLLPNLASTSRPSYLSQQVTIKDQIDILRLATRGLAILKRGPFSFACAPKIIGCGMTLMLL